MFSHVNSGCVEKEGRLRRASEPDFMEVYFDLLPSISNRSSMNISSHLRGREWSKRRAAAGDSESRFLCRRFSSPGNAKDLGSRDA